MGTDTLDPERAVEDRLRADLGGAATEVRAAEVPPPTGPAGAAPSTLALELANLEGWRERVAEFGSLAALHRDLTNDLLELERSGGPPFSATSAPTASATELLSMKRLAAARLGRWQEARLRLRDLEAARPPPGGLGFRFPRSAAWTNAPNGAQYLAARARAILALEVTAVLTITFVGLVASDAAGLGEAGNWLGSWGFPFLLVIAFGGMAASLVEAAHQADVARRSVHLAARLAVRRVDRAQAAPAPAKGGS